MNPFDAFDALPDDPQRPKVRIDPTSLDPSAIRPESLRDPAGAGLRTPMDLLDALPKADPLDALPDDPRAKKPFYLKRWIEQKIFPTVVRVGGAIGGSIIGGMVAGPPGVVIGGAAGAGLGETVAEAGEIAEGVRDTLNPKQIALQTGLGAIPVIGKAGQIGKTVLSRGAQGALLGGASSAMTEMAEDRPVTWQDVVTGAGMGAVMGAGAGRLEAWRLGKKVPPSVHVPEVSPHTDMKITVDGKTETVPPAAALDALPPAAMSDALPAHTTGGTVKGAGDGGVPPVPPVPPSGDMPPPPPGGGKPRLTIAEIEALAKAQGTPIPEAKPLPESRKVEPRMVADLPESQQADVLSIIEEHGGFEAQRRGVQPLARTEALAKGMDVPTERLPKGTILGDVETVALKNARTRVGGEITTLAKKVVDGSASPAETMRLAKLRQDQVILEANYLGVGAEQGRAMNARRLMADAERLYDDDLLHTALRDLQPEDLTTFSRQWAALPDDLSKQQFIHNEMAKQSTWGDWVTSARYANILSGVQTHLKNIFGSAANSGFRDVGKLIGTGIDAGISTVTGKPRTMFLAEMKPEAVATVVGARRGLDAFWFTVKNGFAPRGMQASAFETTRELPGGWKNPLNLPGRLLNAEDAAMFAMRRDKQIAGRAYADARNEGLALGHRGRTLDTFIEDRAAKIMVSPPTEMLAAAEKAAQHDLYRENGGQVTSWISEAKSWPGFPGVVAKLLVPFHKVPGNILRQSIENVPLGFMATKQGRATMQAGGRESRELMGREAASAAVILTLATMAQNGQISGYGPSDPNERARLLKEGWQPHSVRIGNTWIDYTIPLQAIATPIYAIANHYEKWQESKKSFSETALRDVFTTVKSVLDQSFLTGMSDFVQAVNEGDRYGTRFAGNMAASFVPFASASRNYNRLTDATVRDPRSVSDYVAQALPGGQTLVSPKISPTGDIVKKPGGPIMRGVSPIAVSTVTTDPVVSALKTLNITLSAPPRTLDKTRTMPEVPLSTEERTRVGQATHAAAERLVANAAFQALMTKDAEAAGRALNAAINRAREQVYGQIRAAHRRTPR